MLSYSIWAYYDRHSATGVGCYRTTQKPIWLIDCISKRAFVLRFIIICIVSKWNFSPKENSWNWNYICLHHIVAVNKNRLRANLYSNLFEVSNQKRRKCISKCVNIWFGVKTIDIQTGDKFIFVLHKKSISIVPEFEFILSKLHFIVFSLRSMASSNENLQIECW